MQRIELVRKRIVGHCGHGDALLYRACVNAGHDVERKVDIADCVALGNLEIAAQNIPYCKHLCRGKFRVSLDERARAAMPGVFRTEGQFEKARGRVQIQSERKSDARNRIRRRRFGKLRAKRSR